MKHAFIVLVFSVIFLAGCEQEYTEREIDSFTSPAKNREIVFYAADGSVINKWEGHYSLFTQGSTVALKNRGKEVIISGTWVAQDK